jgi:hypothetical protein
LEAKPIADSASSFSGKPSPFPARTFIPIGYISLNADSGDFGLKASYEIAFFYVLAVLQGGGLGRSAIDDAERMGTSEPLCANRCGSAPRQMFSRTQYRYLKKEMYVSFYYTEGC